MTDTPQDFTFFWNGRSLRGRAGDSLAVALWRQGIRVVGRSRKLHRPLGFSGAYVAGVLARVNGIPNVRLDLEPCRPGLKVEAQKAWPSASYDLLPLMQLIPAKRVRGGFEHGRLVPVSGRPSLLWERLMAYLAGGSAPPEAGGTEAPPARRIATDTLVIGGGPAGIAAANEIAATGRAVALVTRGGTLARFASAMGEDVPPLDPRVQLFTGLELFGAYRDGHLFAAAPHDGEKGAVAFDAKKTILATGRRSMPPLVSGSHIPGVMDAHAALALVSAGVRPGDSIAILGTGSEVKLAERLTAAGANIVHAGAIADLRAIHGRRAVTAIDIGHVVSCDTVIHAGPWHADPSLAFQIAAEGHFQLIAEALPPHVTLAGSAAESDESVHIPPAIAPDALVCPCMDVTAGELLDLIDHGETDPEVLKRLSSCGMGRARATPAGTA